MPDLQQAAVCGHIGLGKSFDVGKLKLFVSLAANTGEGCGLASISEPPWVRKESGAARNEGLWVSF